MRARKPVFPKKPIEYEFKNEPGFQVWPNNLVIKIKKWANTIPNSGGVGRAGRRVPGAPGIGFRRKNYKNPKLLRRNG